MAESLRGQIDISKQKYPEYLINIIKIIKYEYDDFIPYADCIGKSVCEYNIVPENNYILLKNIRSKFFDTLKIDYAKRLYDKSIAIGRKKARNNPKNYDYQNELAIDYMNLALLQKEHLNNYESAKNNYIMSTSISVKLPKDNPEYQYQLALEYNNFAVLQEDQLNDHKSAESNYKKAIEIGKLLPKNNPEYQDSLAMAYYNLANLQINTLNDYESAVSNYKKSIEIGKKLPKDNPKYQNDLANAYLNLAVLQEVHFKEYNSAETNYKKEIEIKELLPKDPVYQDSLALAYSNFALFQKDNLKNRESAETYFKKAIETEKTLLEVNRKLFLIKWVEYKYKLAKLYFDVDKVKPAKSILEEIKPLAEECLAKNPDDKNTKDVNNLINKLWEKINK